MWRVYQRGLERWIADLLQPVFDNLVTDGMVPRFVMVRLWSSELCCCHLFCLIILLLGLDFGGRWAERAACLSWHAQPMHPESTIMVLGGSLRLLHSVSREVCGKD